MRVWDLSPACLCQNHLLGEHSEIHALWSIITKNKKGFKNHPETKRWQGKLKALYLRHQKTVQEMEARGYQHQSPLSRRLAQGKSKQKEYVNSIKEQKEIIRKKGCNCRV